MLSATGVSQARCMCLIPSNGSTLELRDFQVDRANANAGSSISRNSSGKIVFWRESVAAADAERLKVPACMRFSLRVNPYEQVEMPVSIGSRLNQR